MTNRILGLALAIALFASVSFRAEANVVWRPYHISFIHNGAVLGWGNWGWPVVNTFPTYPYFGTSYWSYYNYQPYYASFGAIAYSKATGEVGIAWGNENRSIAERQAVNYCGEADCRTVVWVQGGCGSVTKSEASGQIGYAYATSKHLASSYAMRGCQRDGNDDCKQLAWVCSY
jgi:hypothetical protein